MRIHSLDSLRGFAAISVVLYHVFAFVPATQYLVEDHLRSVYTIPSFEIFILQFSPLNIFLRGHDWVIFFFVLSGLFSHCHSTEVIHHPTSILLCGDFAD
jgi:peptidoglycan/LPS O-acetylase OafA/YrhL